MWVYSLEYYEITATISHRTYIHIAQYLQHILTNVIIIFVPGFDKLFLRLKVSIRPTKDFTEKVSNQDKNILTKVLETVFGSGTQLTTFHSTRRNVLLEISYPEENRKQVNTLIESGKVSAAILDVIHKCTEPTFKHSKLSGE